MHGLFCIHHFSHVDVGISFDIMCFWCRLSVRQQMAKDTVFWHLQRLDVGAKTVPLCFWICVSMCVYRSRCIQFQLFQVRFSTLPWEPVLSVLLSYRRRAWTMKAFRKWTQSPPVYRTPRKLQKNKKKKVEFTACNTLRFTLQVIIIISFDITVRIPWLQLKFVINCCQFGDPVISTHFPGEWRLPTGYSCKPRSAVQPCVGGSRYGRCSGQSADFMWQWIHSLVRYLNKNACVKLSLHWNFQVLIFFPQVRQRKLLSGLSIYVTAAALLWPFLFINPLWATISILFHMYATDAGKIPPH